MDNVTVLLFEMDGAVYGGEDLTLGESAFILECRDKGFDCVFVANLGNRFPEVVAEHLLSMDISCRAEYVRTSPLAVALELEEGTST